MTPLEIFLHLCPGDPQRDAAYGALLRLLERIAAGPLREPCRPNQVYFIESPDDQREMAARVALKLVQRPPCGSVLEGGDGRCHTYLEVAVVRTWFSELRTRKRLRLTNDGDIDLGGAPPVPPAAPEMLTEARELLERAFARVLSAQREHDAASARESWKQICELVFDEVPMEDILKRDQGVDEQTPAAEKERARDRVLSAHYRLRRNLVRALDELAAVGELSQEEAVLAREGWRLLFRRQKTTRRAV